MNCSDHYISLGEVPVCDAAAVLPLQADVSGTWAFMASFNGAYQYVQFEGTNGQPLVVPVRLNENYTYTVRLYKPDGSIFNDSYYTIKTVPILPGVLYNVQGDNGDTNVISAGRKQFTATAWQVSVTYIELVNAVEVVVFIEGSIRQEGNGPEEYTYVPITGSIGFNTPLTEDQRITILYFK